MCILLYLKLIWCSGISQIYGQLEKGALVYVHSSICETYLVQWYYIDLWSIGGGEPWYMCILLYLKLIWCSGITQIYGQLEGGYICPGYMCILLYVKLIQCSGIPQMYGLLEGATSALGISAFFYM